MDRRTFVTASAAAVVAATIPDIHGPGVKAAEPCNECCAATAAEADYQHPPAMRVFDLHDRIAPFLSEKVLAIPPVRFDQFVDAPPADATTIRIDDGTLRQCLFIGTTVGTEYGQPAPADIDLVGFAHLINLAAEHDLIRHARLAPVLGIPLADTHTKHRTMLLYYVYSDLNRQQFNEAMAGLKDQMRGGAWGRELAIEEASMPGVAPWSDIGQPDPSGHIVQPGGHIRIIPWELRRRT